MKTFFVMTLLVMITSTAFAQDSTSATCTFVKIKKEISAAVFLKDCTGPVPEEVALSSSSDTPGDTQGLTDLFANASPGDKVDLMVYSVLGEYGGYGRLASSVTINGNTFQPEEGYIQSWQDAEITINE